MYDALNAPGRGVVGVPTDDFILLVEDHDDDVELTCRALRKLGITTEVVVAKDGAEALEMIFPQEPDEGSPCLILLDLKLPKVTGIEILERLRADPATKDIPVVVISTSHEELSRLSTRADLEVVDCVPKVFGSAEFTERLDIIKAYCD